MSRQYLVNGKWEVISNHPPAGDRKAVTKSSKPNGGSSSNTPKSPPKPQPTPTPKDSRGDTSSVTKEANKQYKDGENILEGDLTVRVARPKLKAKQTITLSGLGETLSGLYYVETVTHEFSGTGYNQSLSVKKNGFGESLQVPKDEPRKEIKKEVASSKPSGNEHTIKKGDTLWALSVKHFGTGTRWTEIAKANNIPPGGERKLQIGQKIKLP